MPRLRGRSEGLIRDSDKSGNQITQNPLIPYRPPHNLTGTNIDAPCGFGIQIAIRILASVQLRMRRLTVIDHIEPVAVLVVGGLSPFILRQFDARHPSAPFDLNVTHLTIWAFGFQIKSFFEVWIGDIYDLGTVGAFIFNDGAERDLPQCLALSGSIFPDVA